MGAITDASRNAREAMASPNDFLTSMLDTITKVKKSRDESLVAQSAHMKALAEMQELLPQPADQFKKEFLINQGADQRIVNNLDPKTLRKQYDDTYTLVNKSRENTQQLAQTAMMLGRPDIAQSILGRTTPSRETMVDPSTGQPRLTDEALRQQNQLKEQAALASPTNLPAGTTIRKGGLTIPLNPSLTQEEQKVAGALGTIQGSLQNIRSLIKEGVATKGIKGFIEQAGINSEQPLLVTGKAEAYQSELNYLLSQIPFLRGGKQLTETERGSIKKLLSPFGKSPETIDKDIARFEKEFLNVGSLIGGGTQQATQLQDKNKVETKVNSGTTTSGLKYKIRKK